MIRPKFTLIIPISRRYSIDSLWNSIRGTRGKPKTVSVSLDSLRYPPPPGPFALENAYIPIDRRTVIRELLIDHSVILPHEREQFERLALYLDRKLALQYQFIHNEFSSLIQPMEPKLSSDSIEQEYLESTRSENISSQRLTTLDRREHEFWLLRRLSQLAPQAGFLEVTRDLLEQTCRPRRRAPRDGAVTFIDPNDYHVIRFWIRGAHPFSVSSFGKSSLSGSNEAPVAAGAGFGSRAVNLASKLSSQFILSTKQIRKGLSRAVKRVTSRYFRVETGHRVDLVQSPTDPCLNQVLMAVQCKKDDKLQFKLFEHVPVSGRSMYTDNLCYLLPELRFRPLTAGGRVVLMTSAVTALGCLGLIAPAAWLLTTNPDLVIAWSLAASGGAAATGSLVWARFWRSQAKLAHWIQQLHYHCGRTWGSHALDTMLKLAREEEFKAALLVYALLLRPTEAGSPLTTSQLGMRAESWIAKCLSPTPHISQRDHSSTYSNFSGGSGPLFDLVFNPDRALRLLRQLDLVRLGNESVVRAVPLSTATLVMESDSGRDGGQSNPLWTLFDPLVDGIEGIPKTSETR